LKKKPESTILCVVLYGRETWSLPLTGKYRMTVFEKRVMGKILWCMGGEGGISWVALRGMEVERKQRSASSRIPGVNCLRQVAK
jgi:hypothetical protein